MTDASILINRLIKSRQSVLKIDTYSFTIRRPTAYEAAQLYIEDPSQFDIARDYVDDWDGVHDKDLVPSGGSDVVEFDRKLWGLWLSDKPEFWEPIFNHVIKSYEAQQNKKGDAGKA